MITKLKTIKRFDNETITIKQLQSIVINNPQKELINNIRGLVYKSKEYNIAKLKLNCVMPHGIFNGICNGDISKFSNILFYDIDSIFDIDELDSTIERLKNKLPIYFLQKSLSNKGFHFFIKIDDTFLLTDDTFSFVYSFVREILLEEGFNIDMSASGLSRKMIISYDENCYFNENNEFKIDKTKYQSYVDTTNSANKVKIKVVNNESRSTTLNDTFFELIQISDLMKQINIQTQFVEEIVGDFMIKDMDFYYILLPQNIKDGTKHKLYTRIVNGLYFINESISRRQILSYLYYVNNRADPQMGSKYLFMFITNLCDNIEQNGIRLKYRIKKIHFNKESELTKKQKQIMSAKINGILKTNKARKAIKEARNKLLMENKKDTQPNVMEITGFSLSKIKRNWNLDISDVKDILVPKIEDIDVKKLLLLDILEEDDFFENN